MKFIKDASYTRSFIHEAVGGGSLQSYLPDRYGKVLCACLSPDMNANAPNVILVGDHIGVLRCGKMLSKQKGAIPVFIKHGVNDWRYAGMYEVERSTVAGEVVSRHTVEAGRVIRMVIYMREVQE